MTEPLFGLEKIRLKGPILLNTWKREVVCHAPKQSVEVIRRQISA